MINGLALANLHVRNLCSGAMLKGRTQYKSATAVWQQPCEKVSCTKHTCVHVDIHASRCYVRTEKSEAIGSSLS